MPDQQDAIFQLSEDLLDEIEHLNSQVLDCFQQKNLAPLFHIHQKIRHVTMRIRGLEDEV